MIMRRRQELFIKNYSIIILLYIELLYTVVHITVFASMELRYGKNIRTVVYKNLKFAIIGV